MIKLRRGILLFSVVLFAAAIAILAATAMVSWWALLALIPLAMVVVCVAMVAGRGRIPGGGGAARCGCCAVSAVTPVSCGSGSQRSQRPADAHG